MNQHQCQALTLRTYPYAEYHKIAVFLTREFGKVRGVAHGAKKPNSRFGSALEPLTMLRLTFYRKEHQELAVIQNCEIIRAFPAFQLSWEVNLHFSYFAELLIEFSREQEESDRLFRLALAVLEASQTMPIRWLARYLEIWLLRLEGVLPALDEKLPVDLARKTAEMLRLHPTGIGACALAEDEVERLERFARDLIEQHLEKSLKTARMLKDLL